MENLLSIVSLVAGLGAGTLFFVTARKQPEKAQQLRTLGGLFYGIAALMLVLLFV